VEVEIRLVEETEEGIEESELDEMWSYVSRKSNQRWLWHAIDRLTGQVLAYSAIRSVERDLKWSFRMRSRRR